jgi:NADH-quinone oxidoreductase subunit K
MRRAFLTAALIGALVLVMEEKRWLRHASRPRCFCRLFSTVACGTKSSSRHLLFLIGIQMILGAANLNLSRSGAGAIAAATGIADAIFSIAIAAAEAAVGLALVIAVYRHYRTTNVGQLDRNKDEPLDHRSSMVDLPCHLRLGDFSLPEWAPKSAAALAIAGPSPRLCLVPRSCRRCKCRIPRRSNFTWFIPATMRCHWDGFWIRAAVVLMMITLVGLASSSSALFNYMLARNFVRFFAYLSFSPAQCLGWLFRTVCFFCLSAGNWSISGVLFADWVLD